MVLALVLDGVRVQVSVPAPVPDQPPALQREPVRGPVWGLVRLAWGATVARPTHRRRAAKMALQGVLQRRARAGGVLRDGTARRGPVRACGCSARRQAGSGWGRSAVLAVPHGCCSRKPPCWRQPRPRPRGWPWGSGCWCWRPAGWRHCFVSRCFAHRHWKQHGRPACRHRWMVIRPGPMPACCPDHGGCPDRWRSCFPDECLRHRCLKSWRRFLRWLGRAAWPAALRPSVAAWAVR